MVDQGWYVLESDSFAREARNGIVMSMHHCGNG